VAFAVGGTNTYNFGGLKGADRLGNNATGIGANTVSVGANGQNTTFTGDIFGTGNLTKVGVGTLTLTGSNTYTGVTNVNQGKLLVNGTHTGVGTYTVAAGGTLGGSGTISSLVQGAGLGSPGNSPGIFAVSQTDPSGGMDFGFEFTQLGDPTWSNATASGNDVWRLTHASNPFPNGPFDSDNVIDIYLGVTGVTTGDIFRGGFFTDLNSDFLATVVGADYNFWILGDGAGTATTFNGQGYYDMYSYTGYFLNVSTHQVPSANFASGTINNGWEMEFTAAVPEPSTWVLGLTGLLGLGLLGWRRRE
jgi:autotransporter-associated beta strand protein